MPETIELPKREWSFISPQTPQCSAATVFFYSAMPLLRLLSQSTAFITQPEINFPSNFSELAVSVYSAALSLCCNLDHIFEVFEDISRITHHGYLDFL